MADRATLKQSVMRAHTRWDQARRRMVCPCPWCGRPIEEGFDLHEFLVKRSAVPREQQDLIMQVPNLAPVHHACHMQHGQTRDFAIKCLRATALAITAMNVGQWYVALWREHGLSVPRGFLVPPRNCATGDAMRLIDSGLALRGIELPADWSTEDGDDVRGLAIQRWRQGQGRVADGVEISGSVVSAALSDGYWLAYLDAVIGR